MFVTRLISGIVLVLITVSSMYFGGPYLFALTFLISLIGMWELNKLVGINNKLIGYASYLAAAVYYVTLLFNNEELHTMTIVLGLMIIIGCYVFSYPKFEASQVAVAFLSFIYVAVLMSFSYRLRCLEHGLYLVWLIYICAWGNDTCAYLTGITLGRNGKHKMAPKLSPKKSVEGFVGGIAGSALLSMIYAFIIKDYIPGISNPVILFAVVGVAGAGLGVIGDLASSAFKRNYNVKDYGTIIPGHGGILDRYDSVIFVAPVVYYLVELMNRIL